MIRRNDLRSAALVLIALSAAQAQASAADSASTLLVANRSSHEVTFVDLNDGAVVARIPTGAGPHLLSNVSDGLVVATGYGDFPQPHEQPVDARPPFVTEVNSRFTLIDVERRAVVLDTRLEACTKPHASWIVADRAYVTCEDERQLVAVDLHNGKVAAELDTRQDGTHVLSFDPASRTLAASNTGSGSVTLFRLDTAASQVVPLASGSEGALAVGGRIWVANGGAGSVSVVEAATGAVVKTVDDLCQFPIAFSAAADGNLWLACFASSELIEFDAAAVEPLRHIALDDQPLNLLAHPTEPVVYVSYPRKNAIGEIDIGSGRELRRIEVGIEPDGLRWAAGR